MQTCHHHINADEYIRRLDRMVLAAGIVTVSLALTLVV